MILLEWLIARRIALLPSVLKSRTTECISDFRNLGNLSIGHLFFLERILYLPQVIIPDRPLSYVNSGYPESLNSWILECLSLTSQTILPAISPANFLVQINNIRLHSSSKWLSLSCSGFVWLYEHQRICEALWFTLSKGD
ncbi:hypothetical protein ACFO4P_15550 [Epilithonimonas pallida]|uniref:Transposase n=1 Tax=Epilithonimonas pallida TaxID=373671 RepID=A0ABY1QZ36_9FLAO|nr:hypothetical protein [Epilithonimonas pallida]SMP88242.1 hypothetical protein SAMN05421679_101445 [Epilithonimonas pallida]